MVRTGLSCFGAERGKRLLETKTIMRGSSERLVLCFDVLHSVLKISIFDQAHTMEPCYGISDTE
jgi:hypothetical protein